MNERIPTQQWLDSELAKCGSLSREEVAKIFDTEGKRAKEFIRAHEGADVIASLTGMIEMLLDARDEESKVAREFADEVTRVFELQAQYFKTRRSDALAASKVAERALKERARKIARRQWLGPSE